MFSEKNFLRAKGKKNTDYLDYLDYFCTHTLGNSLISCVVYIKKCQLMRVFFKVYNIDYLDCCPLFVLQLQIIC